MVVRVVSEQSAEDIRKSRAKDGLVDPLRVLTANLLRIVRGGGKPVELLRQMERCAISIREYALAHGHLPSAPTIHHILDCEAAQLEYRPWIKEALAEELRRWEDDGSLDRKEAERRIRNASLQIAASMLLDQMTQCSVAEYDFHAGAMMLEAAGEKSRRYHSPAKAATRKARRSSSEAASGAQQAATSQPTKATSRPDLRRGPNAPLIPIYPDREGK
jgi:hypothetical protein